MNKLLNQFYRMYFTARHLLANLSKKLIILLTAQAKEYSLDKVQTSYDDLLDGLRLSLKRYDIK
jgi:hypothetical protein